jgi:hypothetical protein
MTQERKTTKDGVTVPRRKRIRSGSVTVDIHTPGRGFNGASWFLFGWQFGPVAAILAEHCEDAYEEWDEHYGERVDVNSEDDKRTLADYEPNAEALAQGRSDLEARAWSAMDAGDIRMNGSGTTVWVDHYKWCQEVDSAARKRRRRLGR